MPHKRKRRSTRDQRSRMQPLVGRHQPSKLRIVAGHLRRSLIRYNGDPATRPMKERTRESVFSLLGGHCDGRLALDLFGGTGILAFESVSRGAELAIVLELARPAVETMLENMRHLGLADQVELHNVDTLRWLQRLDEHVQNWPNLPWIIFCCPPYRMWTTHREQLLDGLQQLVRLSPANSQFICESDCQFADEELPELDWDIRTYPPAVVAYARKP